MKRGIAILLCAALLAALCACGRAGQTTPSGKSDDRALRVGVLFPDNANATGISYYHLLGLQKAAQELELDEPLWKYNVKDTTFDADAPLPEPQSAAETTSAPDEPESYTTADGEVIVRGVPALQDEPQPAVDAAVDLAAQGCTVIVAADARYDDVSAYLAKNMPDVTFLQYRGTHDDLSNLQNFSAAAYEAFYLAGAAAGAEGVKRIGFTAGTGDEAERACINAFALGVQKTNPDAAIVVRFTTVAFDLSLERTLPIRLIEEDKCELLAQSVFTALPVSVAAGSGGTEVGDPLPCIGHGYDMASDGGSRYLCSVTYDFSVYYARALREIRNHAFRSDAYIGGVREGIVGLSALQHASDKTVQTVQSLTEQYQNGTLHPFDGFTPDTNGYAANVTIKEKS